MKILITGTSGFIGKSFQEHFEQTNEVVTWSRNSISLTAALNLYRPELILHCAAEIYNADVMQQSNIGLVYEILEWQRLNPAARMITIGSSAEYGPVDRATRETDRINPQNVYEATKGAATLLCQGYARQFGIHTCVSRIYSGYGAYERSRRLFPTLYRAFFKNEPMTVFEGVHDFIYIKDFIRGIEILIAHDWPAGELVNFGSGVQTTNSQVLAAWERVTGRQAPVTFKDSFMRAHDTLVWQCDTAYAREQYGFTTEYTLDAGIADMIERLQ